MIFNIYKMGILLNMKFTYDFFKCWVTQISLVALIRSVKLFRITDRYTENDVLNIYFDQGEKETNKLIENGDLKTTDGTNILYYESIPKTNNYPGKCILFIGGRNNINANVDFCKRLSDYMKVTVITFQYAGYYKSGNDSGLTHESYLETINIVYNMSIKKYDTYIVGYSIGCYGSYLINEKQSIFLISPFYSLQKSVRDCVKIQSFNLGELMNKKYIDRIIIHGYYGDLVNPLIDLIGPFNKPNVFVTKHKGNHVSGLSNMLFDDIKTYMNSFNMYDSNVEEALI